MSRIINLADQEVIAKVINYLAEEKKVELALDADDYDDVAAVTDIVAGTLEAIGVILGEEKSETEDVTINIADALSATVSYREGAGEGNYTLSVVPGAEMKKGVKVAYEK